MDQHQLLKRERLWNIASEKISDQGKEQAQKSIDAILNQNTLMLEWDFSDIYPKDFIYLNLFGYRFQFLYVIQFNIDLSGETWQ